MNRAYQPARFSPQEILFAPSSACNLDCAHCVVRKDRRRLSPAVAVRFLKSAKAAGLYTVVTPTQWSVGQDFSAADLILDNLDAAGPDGTPHLTLERLQGLHAAALRPAAA